MPKVLLCDDHSIVRCGLKNIISANFSNHLTYETASVAEALSLIDSKEIDFAIFDLQLIDGNMLEHLSSFISKHPLLNILVYSMCNEEIYGKRVLQMGASGFLSKNADEGEVLRALQSFLTRQTYMSAKLNNLLIKTLRNNKGDGMSNPFLLLSNREIEVTQHLLTGKSLKEISTQMKLHANTIVTYKNRIFDKFSIKNTFELNNIAKLYQFV